MPLACLLTRTSHGCLTQYVCPARTGRACCGSSSSLSNQLSFSPEGRRGRHRDFFTQRKKRSFLLWWWLVGFFGLSGSSGTEVVFSLHSRMHVRTWLTGRPVPTPASIVFLSASWAACLPQQPGLNPAPQTQPVASTALASLLAPTGNLPTAPLSMSCIRAGRRFSSPDHSGQVSVLPEHLACFPSLFPACVFHKQMIALSAPCTLLLWAAPCALWGSP